MSEGAWIIIGNIFLLLICIFMIFGYQKMYNDGYKQGQIDGKSGKWKIVEVTNKEWVEAK